MDYSFHSINMTLFILSIFPWEKEGRDESVIMCYETKGEGEERKNPVQQNQPANKHIPVRWSPEPGGDVGQELPHPPSVLDIHDLTQSSGFWQWTWSCICPVSYLTSFSLSDTCWPWYACIFPFSVSHSQFLCERLPTSSFYLRSGKNGRLWNQRCVSK